MKLKTLHRISGIVIAAFLVLHLCNHLFALGGPALHITVMKYFRMVYRFPPVEIILLLCVTIQIVSGLRLVFYKRVQEAAISRDSTDIQRDLPFAVSDQPCDGGNAGQV